MKKDFLKGIIVSALIFTGTTVFASANYEALEATFPILVNGNKWTSEKPALVVEGSTYLPLKAIGEALNVDVSWNAEKGQVEINNTQTNTYEQKDKYNLGDTFLFDDLEITLGTEYSFTTLQNEFSEYNGKTVLALPITVKNLKDETHSLNMFYYNCYGASGTEVKKVNSYFDDNIDYAGKMRTGSSMTKKIYVLYDGNGTYSIEFEKLLGNPIIVEFQINK